VSTPQSTYTHGHHESVLRSHRWRTAENSAGYLLPRLRAGMSLLDVGCGPGSITADLAGLLAPGRVLGIDPAPDVVEQARTLVAARAAGSADVVVGDVHTLDPQVERFDVVHAHQVLQHLPDPVAALRAMGRLCLPGGLLAARDSDYGAFTWYPQLPELTEWMGLYQRAARANGGQPDAGRRLLSWARAAGAVEVTAGASTWCFSTAADRAWWGGIWADRILESALARQVVDTGLATLADLRRISAGWLRWAQAQDGWFAILHGEILCRMPA
jgi:SAM-dependent methyltransferase